MHQANYKRKPRGLGLGPEESLRHSFCCGQEGCRRRHTPPSVRFLGRRVYVGVVVLLLAAMRHGLKPEQVKELREKLGVDRRLLERWRRWWLEGFVQSRFWKAARARFLATFCEESLPLSLCEAFEIEHEHRHRLLDLLRFLSPLSASAHLLEHGF